MAKRKRQRFAEVTSFPNVYEFGFQDIKEGLKQKGDWRATPFKNNNPIILELGCGKGEYTVGLAKKYPDKNFIGIDIKGNRIWRGAKTALDEKISNVAFLRTRIDFIEACFAKDEVDEIWITFPDPQPQKKRERKRLTSVRFLDRYKNLMKQNGVIHLKTDNEPFWQYTMEVIADRKYPLLCSTNNLYGQVSDEYIDAASIQTFYEALFRSKGFKICYLKFKLS